MSEEKTSEELNELAKFAPDVGFRDGDRADIVPLTREELIESLMDQNAIDHGEFLEDLSDEQLKAIFDDEEYVVVITEEGQ